MKMLVALLLTGLVSVAASADPLWMNVLSAQINEASAVVIDDAKDIPDLAADLGLKTLGDLIGAANLTDTLKGTGPFTVFGPTDDAFARLPKELVDFLMKNTTMLAELLKYHVVQGKAESGNLTNDELLVSLEGKSIRINEYTKERDNKTETVITASGRRVSKADQEASNGVIHVVDGVLFPPPGSVADVVAKVPAFKLLMKGLVQAGLVDTLNGDGPFTLFAPTNKAISRIPRRCLIRLFEDKAKLTKVLTYHVVPSTAYSAGLSCGDKLKTVEGSEVEVRFHHRRIYVNRAAVVFPDVSVTNGVIHVIDGVLFPDDFINGICNEFIDRPESNYEKGEPSDVSDWLDIFS